MTKVTARVTTMIDTISALKRTQLFKSLGDKELNAIAELCRERRLVRGETLFSAGEPARGIYVIASGAVRAVRESPDGREQVIHVEAAGATIAEVPVFDDGPYPSTVIAEEDAVLLFIAKEDIRRMCIEYPQIALSALSVLAARLRKCAELVEKLSLQPVNQRLADWLYQEAIKNGMRTDKGIRIDLKLTNQEIAARIGSVREVISRSFNYLQQEQLISVDRRSVYIPDIEKLKAFAG